jgi:RNA polymerase primary sigma factor
MLARATQAAAPQRDVIIPITTPRGSSLDAVDLYLAQVGRGPLLGPGEEVALSEQILRAEAELFEAVLDAGVALPELEEIANQLDDGSIGLTDVCDELDARKRQPKETVRLLREVCELERRFEALRLQLARRGLGVEARRALRKRIDKNRDKRNQGLCALGLHRDHVRAMAERVKCDLRTLADAEDAIHAARRRRRGLDAEERKLRLEAAHEARAVLRRAEQTFGRPRADLIDVYHRIARAEAESRRAKEMLVGSNLRLVVLFAAKYRERGVPFADLIQEGNIGLMRAADRYDHRVGTRFSTYAGWWLRQSMQRAVMGQGSTIRLPVYVHASKKQSARVASVLSHDLGREPDAEEVAKVLGTDADSVRRTLRAGATTLSLHATVDGEADGRQLLETLADETFESADDVTVREEQLEQVRSALGILSQREQRVLQLRFGMDGQRPRTLTEIGKEFQLTRERIRQIEANALKKLRRAFPEEQPA